MSRDWFFIGDLRDTHWQARYSWWCAESAYFQGRYVLLTATELGLDVLFCPQWPQVESCGVCFRMRTEDAVAVVQEKHMALKWIKEAMAKCKKGKENDLPPVPELHEGREALMEFMTATRGPDGKARNPSVLMVCVTDDGVRCGLKDDDCGGWCWRSGGTFSEALDAVEKALRGGEGAFRAASNNGKKR